MVGTSISFCGCRRNIPSRGRWSYCWVCVGWNSVGLRFRWRLAVGLLRVWHGRLCLVCLLVFSVL